jgi:hypothetical protein
MSAPLKEWLYRPYGEMTIQEIDDRHYDALAALRAVVELHHETEIGEGYSWQTTKSCADCGEEYPCETIRAIEKEVLRG